jgi:hypothetical protein
MIEKGGRRGMIFLGKNERDEIYQVRVPAGLL